MRAMGSRRDNRQIARNAADTDVEEAAEYQPCKQQRAFKKEVQALLEYVVAGWGWKSDGATGVRNNRIKNFCSSTVGQTS